MAEPFKHLIDADSIADHAARLSAIDPDFPAAAFIEEATEGLDDLELKARVAHVAEALRQALPEDWPTALGQLVDSLPPALAEAEGVSGLMHLWPVLHCVGVYGLDHPERSLDALPALTRRFSAEFTIRPFLRRHPELTWGRIHDWVDHLDVHVRRLCSEGTRPRLPWGGVLRDAVADPSRGLAVLERLVDDPERYVQTSVANHLNDVSKDHPERAVQVAEGWLSEPTEAREWVVRRGLRTLVKKGHPDALALLGFGPPRASLEALVVQPDPLAIGSVGKIRASLRAEVDQRWLVDWVVRAPRADGSLSERVVKGTQRQVRAGEIVEVTGRLSLKPVTTRVTRPGRWRAAVQVNGEILGEVDFEVVGEAR